MANFSQEIANFTNLGIYHYRFDEVGNEILNPSSSVFQETYFAFPLRDLVYNQNKIQSFYDTTFTEFVRPVVETSTTSSVQDMTDQLAQVTSQNEQLQAQLDELISLSEQSSGTATLEAIKDIILGLRIQLGEGKIEADFNTEFPYYPLPTEEQPSSETTE